MLAFIIPVKHPSSCRSYDVVSALLKQTLHSVCRQTSDDFRVIVVCNRKPRYSDVFKNTSFVEVDFPPPQSPVSKSEEHSHVFLDKGCKQAIGLVVARQYNPKHIMFTDADDFVSCRIAEFTKMRPAEPGWFFEKGLVFSNLSKVIEERHRFWSYCGTSHILRHDLIKIPASLSVSQTKQELINSIGLDYLTRILGDHNRYQHLCNSQGETLKPLPFNGAIWRADTGENSSRVVWGQRRFGPIWGQTITPEISKEFGIDPQNRSTRETLITVLWRVRHLTAKTVKTLIRN